MLVRAQEIQELLNITEIEETRKTLVRVENDFRNELEISKRGVETARAAVSSTINKLIYKEEDVLQEINKNRKKLSAQPISKILSTEIKKGITVPTAISESHAIDITQLKKDIQNLVKINLAQNQEKIAEDDKELRKLIKSIKADSELYHAYQCQELIESGIELIDETGACPLCDKHWPPGELCKYLKRKLKKSEKIGEYQEKITELSTDISNSITETTVNIKEIVQVVKTLELRDELRKLTTWIENLVKLSRILEDPIEDYPSSQFNEEQVRKMLAPENISESLTKYLEIAKLKFPEATPEQIAWETLIRLEENFKALEQADSKYKITESCLRKASIILKSYQMARDKILGELYENIRDRFVSLYRQLHKIDEERFNAKIEPQEAGLNLEVDFYGRGTHPPHALHSEGHQDSMGLCLYLALAERLTGDLIDLIILDDVVMSVDADHRRDVCHLLATSFPNHQFLITTHDKTWANQLKNEGVVSSKEKYEFYNWHIELGPQVIYGSDMWKRIEEDLQRNDVHSASAKLRRGSEEFFDTVCDALQATTTHKSDGRYELGDLMPAAYSKYKRLLVKARKSANSWNNRELVDEFNEMDSIATSIYARTNAEQWAVNPSVHYSKWENFTSNDFKPVVEAFQDLFNLFICSGCGGLFHLSLTKNKIPESVRCKCGEVNWNLIVKS